MSDANARRLREDVEGPLPPGRSRLRVVESRTDALDAADRGLSVPPGRRFERTAPDAPGTPQPHRRTRAASVAEPVDPPEFMAPVERPAPPGPPHPRSRIRPDLHSPAATAPPAHDSGQPASDPAPLGLDAYTRDTAEEPAAPAPAAPRPTIRITGQNARRPDRPRPSAAARGARPDRLALWAVGLALFMAFMAAATAEAAPATDGAAPAVGPALMGTR